ncbi:MAG: LURP-one-related family protein [Clostridia bacterium]|nr:LURP-one-related family protein [Clostridia bacterium]
MKLLFKQRFFSWLDSYDIFDEYGQTVYTVKGQLSWTHKLKIFDANDMEVGTVEQAFLTWLPKFEIYIGGRYVGCIKKEFTFFKPRFSIDFNGWSVKGDFFEWDYEIYDGNGFLMAVVSKELFNFTDTYSIDLKDDSNALGVLMLVLAIDAEKCSRN